MDEIVPKLGFKRDEMVLATTLRVTPPITLLHSIEWEFINGNLFNGNFLFLFGFTDNLVC